MSPIHSFVSRPKIKISSLAWKEVHFSMGKCTEVSRKYWLHVSQVKSIHTPECVCVGQQRGLCSDFSTCSMKHREGLE